MFCRHSAHALASAEECAGNIDGEDPSRVRWRRSRQTRAKPPVMAALIHKSEDRSEFAFGCQKSSRSTVGFDRDIGLVRRLFAPCLAQIAG